MIHRKFFASLVVLCVLPLLLPCTGRAENARFIIDGDTREWSGDPGTEFDSDTDVMPEQVDAIDLRGISYIRDFFLSGNQEEAEGFVFCISLNDDSPTPFAGPEERSLEIYFDTVAQAGDPTTAWKDTPYGLFYKASIDGIKLIPFAPDQRIRVTWKEENVVELVFEVWDGSTWQTQHVGTSIPEMATAILGRRMEGAVRWSYITPQRYTEGDEDYAPFVFALRTTQGENHDYYPNPGCEWWRWSGGLSRNYMTAVRAVNWGWLKREMK